MIPPSIYISVQEVDFSLEAEVEKLHAMARAPVHESEKGQSSPCGAVVTFTGLVRGGGIAALELEHYPGMTERCLEEIANNAQQRFGLQALRIVHRVGRLLPQAQIVLVAAAAAHRQAAFDGASFVMDYLKTEAPFWKKESLSDGSSHWVDARESDDTACQRWERSAVKAF